MGPSVSAAATMDAEACAGALNVSRETRDRLEAYVELLLHWQRRINLIGAGTADDVWARHVLDSAQLARYVPEGAEVITDLGSGAGLPGLVLAIVLGRATHLVEANGRKCAFLREAVRLTGAPATVHHGRAEALQPWPSDVVTARALAPLGRLLGLAVRYLRPGAESPAFCLFLKGRQVEEELTRARIRWHMEVDRFASVTDDAGIVLRIRGLSRG